MPDETRIQTSPHAQPTRAMPSIPKVASGPPPPGAPGSAPSGPGRGVVAIIALVALIVGAAGGWFVRDALDDDPATPAGEDAASTSSTPSSTPTGETTPTTTGDGGVAGTVAIDGPRSTTVGEAVTFTAEADGTPLTFDWELGGEAREGRVVTFAWSEAGPQPIRLTVGYANGTSTMETVIEVVEAEADTDAGNDDDGPATTDAEPSLLTADFRWSPERPQVGQSISLIDTSDGPVAQRRWNWRSSSIVSSSPQSVSTSFSEDTEVTLTVCLADGATCDTVTKLIEVG
ncbi:MAG: hypothetical protein S0880_16670 [Actinomycetota bacterium]|nr:hypothetical protein [Actinomycetota bacterium]